MTNHRWIVYSLAILAAGAAAGPIACGVGSSCEDTGTCGVFPAGAGGSGGAMPEDCTNGVDDDHDGQPDCADQECSSGYGCVAGPPVPWDGFYHLKITQDLQAPLHDCAGVDTLTYYEGPTPAACTACECDLLKIPACPTPTITCWKGNEDCEGNGVDYTKKFGIDCYRLSTEGTFRSCRLGEPVTSMETTTICKSEVSTVQGEPWQARLDICPHPVGSSAGCADGTVCAPEVQLEPDESICIRRDGHDAQCPAEWPETHLAFEDGKDERTCSRCACIAGECQEGWYQFSDSNTCKGSIVPVISPTCTEVSSLFDNNTASVKLIPATRPNPCTVVGGDPGGQVTGSGPVTFCCRKAGQ